MSYCHSIDVLYSFSGNSCSGNTTYTSKNVDFRHRMTPITSCRYGTPAPPPPLTNSITIFLNVVIRTNMLPRNTILKFTVL